MSLEALKNLKAKISIRRNAAEAEANNHDRKAQLARAVRDEADMLLWDIDAEIDKIEKAEARDTSQ